MLRFFCNIYDIITHFTYPPKHPCMNIYTLFNFQYSEYVHVLSDITVHPSINSYELVNLRSGSIYCVQLSAYTAAGEGKRSEPKCFDTLGEFFSAVTDYRVLLSWTNWCSASVSHTTGLKSDIKVLSNIGSPMRPTYNELCIPIAYPSIHYLHCLFLRVTGEAELISRLQVKGRGTPASLSQG